DEAPVRLPPVECIAVAPLRTPVAPCHVLATVHPESADRRPALADTRLCGHGIDSSGVAFDAESDRRCGGWRHTPVQCVPRSPRPAVGSESVRRSTRDALHDLEPTAKARMSIQWFPVKRVRCS